MLALCASAATFALAAPARGAATIVVTSTADSGANTLRDALAAANPGDTISIPTAGDYQVSSAELAVGTNVSIVGSGPGVRIVADGNNRVFNVTAANATISDLTVTGGGQAGVSASGGGIANGTGTLLLRNLTVSGNSVTSASGGIPSGGGVFNDSGTLQIVSSTITGNTASTTAGGGVPTGGGVANRSGTVTITRSTVSENTSTGANGSIPQAGGVASAGGHLDLVDSMVADNEAVHGQVPEGAGILARETATTITGSTVTRNDGTATAGGSFSEGGGIMQIQGSLTLLNSTVGNNSVSGAAGSTGGGIELANTTLEATNATITSNIAAGPGSLGGNISLGASGGPPSIKPLNTIVADGSAATGPNCAIGAPGDTQSRGHNIESLNDCAFTAAGDLVNTDPGLSDLGDNGGPTETLALALDSPAINAGTNTGCPATDQRGVPRPQDGTCDVGAFERAFSADLAVSVAGQPQSTPVGVPFPVKVGVNNLGPDLAADVIAGNLVPAGARLVSVTPSQGTCDLAAGSCALGRLAPDSRAEVSLVVLPTKPGALTNTFRASGRRPDPSAGNDAASISVRVTPLALTHFSSASKRFRLGTGKPRLARRVAAGTKLRFSLSAPARATFVFARRTKKGRHIRFVKAGTLSVGGKAGGNTLRFQGRLSNGKALRAGTYRVGATAVDAFGNKSTPRRLTLRLLAA